VLELVEAQNSYNSRTLRYYNRALAKIEVLNLLPGVTETWAVNKDS
jgi:hypothetical protein